MFDCSPPATASERATGTGLMRVLVVDDLVSVDRPPGVTLRSESGSSSIIIRFSSMAHAPAALHGVDLAVLDVAVLERDGLHPLRRLLGANPRVGVLVIATSLSVGLPAHTPEPSAPELSKTSPRIAQVIRTLGHLALDVERRRLTRQHSRDPQARTGVARLTARERDVLTALADGLTDREIAQRLSVSTDTIRKHMVHILAKLRVHSRAQALVFAVRHGVVTID
jgi:DNA-binding NarL/FixJ family response regulator